MNAKKILVTLLLGAMMLALPLAACGAKDNDKTGGYERQTAPP